MGRERLNSTVIYGRGDSDDQLELPLETPFPLEDDENDKFYVI